ncbi:ATP-binding protein, partial [Coprobacter sp.]
ENISNLPPNTAILFGTWKVDASNAFFMKNAIYTMSGVNPKVPVFSITASGLNNWALGGYSPSYRQQGAGMAVQAINIEQGKDAEIEFIPNQYLFDFNKVKELGIPLNKIPENSELLNKEQPLWIKYPVEFISGVVALAILLIAFFCTLYFYFRTKKVKEHLEISEKELIIAKDRAEESNRLKSAFLANMSHEIRTPLNAIVGFSTVLAEENENMEQQEYLNIIQKNSDLLLRLINDILDVSRLESGRVQFNFSYSNITLLCQDQIAMINQVKKTEASYIFKASEPLSMVTDPQRLQQILINLLNNAGKFTPKGTITLSYKIEPQNNRVVFSVTDTGCGIPKENQSKVFERFEKLNEFEQGTGLGLSICKLTINKMGGDIWIDPDYTEGARFCFSHPLDLKTAKETNK